MKEVLWIVLFSLRSHEGTCGHGVSFTKHPANQTVSQGNAARLGCAVEGLAEPEIFWMKDGEKLYSTDQMFLTLGETHWETYHSVKSVQQQDAGQYWCEVEFNGLTLSSERAWITVEGVPHFVQEPQDVSTFPNVPFNLTCTAGAALAIGGDYRYIFSHCGAPEEEEEGGGAGAGARGRRREEQEVRDEEDDVVINV